MNVFRSVPGVQRGCGTRTENGVYLECGLSPYGVPLAHFIQDTPPPFKVDCKTGVQLWEHPETGVYHVIDWIGATHYPFACDVVEEGRRYGFSRKVMPQLRFELLTEDSRIFLVHPKGRITNPEDFSMKAKEQERVCAHFQRQTKRLQPTENPSLHIEHGDYPCNALQYATAYPTEASVIPDGMKASDAINTVVVERGLLPHMLEQHYAEHKSHILTTSEIENAVYWRSFASFRYRVYPDLFLEDPDPSVSVFPVYEPAVIAILPITNISVIRCKGSDKHNRTFARVRARTYGINVEIADS